MSKLFFWNSLPCHQIWLDDITYLERLYLTLLLHLARYFVNYNLSDVVNNSFTYSYFVFELVHQNTYILKYLDTNLRNTISKHRKQDKFPKKYLDTNSTKSIYLVIDTLKNFL